MTNTIVTTDRLTKRYGEHAAADEVSLTVHAGEVYGFLGPNGAGKTTMLRMLLGLLRPTSGSATILGHAPGHPAAVAGIGALIEGPGFYPYLSGRDNLRVLTRYQGIDDGSADDALRRVELSSRGGDPFRTYSLGMKQRLGVASALLGDPELLILDEPTNGLDPAGMAEMRRLIVDLAEGGQTVILSSHILSEVQEICDRVGVISNGRLLAESTVSELRGGSTLRVRAEPVDTALAVAMGIAGDDAVRVVDDGLDIDVDVSAAPRIARELVEADVAIHEIRPTERSLEDVFFEMTSDRTDTEPSTDHAEEGDR
ncbi:ATP-binding cassette domain-containing protein [Phytoactinopolyspora halotolerans]|uniref:ATP-binding cassette domain-containing protein n=1 Tax=Phytoactinopolyspora halotolerans TaxID=1981512 RepID=A0A6L9S997_9ACTN|nr:ATP-binding cassette domain-containing protein [Phytoactinopolyspora halotolerans]NEE01603.1 ATP-binding cassette domain-containing protein [Phytoactinopolyspora halotolerans]